jgi:hypothetical protein
LHVKKGGGDHWSLTGGPSDRALPVHNCYADLLGNGPIHRKTKLAIGRLERPIGPSPARGIARSQVLLSSFFHLFFFIQQFFSYIIYVYNLLLHKKLCAQLIIYRKIMYTTCR